MDAHSINCTFSILCTVLLFLGASFSTTRYFQIKRLYSDVSAEHYALGVAYYVSGFTGLIAACLQRRISYICQSVLGSVCLVVTHIIYLVELYKPAPEAPFSPERCYIKDGICVCSTSSLRILLRRGLSCHDLNYMRSLGISCDVLFVLGAVILIIIIIISGILSRRTRQLDPNQLVIPTQNVYFSRDNVGFAMPT